MSVHARTTPPILDSSHHLKSHRNGTRLALATSANPRHKSSLPPLELQTPLRRPRRIDIPQLAHDISDDEEPGTSAGRSSSSLSAPADILRLMDSLQVPVEADVYAALLRECAVSADAEQGAAIHAHLRRGGGRRLCGHGAALVANRLLLMYCACGRTDDALDLFDRMPGGARGPATWATVIAGLAENGDPARAMRMFVEMFERACERVLLLPVGSVCLGAVLESCARSGEFRFGQCVHGLVLKVMQSGRPADDRHQLGRSLVQFYSRFDCLKSARRVFNEMGSGSRDPTCVQTLIKAYCKVSRFHEALGFFKATRTKTVRKNSSVVVTVLKACGDLDADEGIRHGLQLHATVIKTGMDADRFVQLGLVRMYGRLGLPTDARKAFDELVSEGEDDEACWGEMLGAYMRSGRGMEALRLLYEMKAAGLRPRESMVVDAKLACGGVY